MATKEEKIIILEADIEANKQRLAKAEAEDNEKLILMYGNRDIEMRQDLQEPDHTTTR